MVIASAAASAAQSRAAAPPRVTPQQQIGATPSRRQYAGARAGRRSRTARSRTSALQIDRDRSRIGQQQSRARSARAGTRAAREQPTPTVSSSAGTSHAKSGNAVRQQAVRAKYLGGSVQTAQLVERSAHETTAPMLRRALRQWPGRSW